MRYSIVPLLKAMVLIGGESEEQYHIKYPNLGIYERQQIRDRNTKKHHISFQHTISNVV
jgi:hypothetical protein